jgi:hypothetical protein
MILLLSGLFSLNKFFDPGLFIGTSRLLVDPEEGVIGMLIMLIFFFHLLNSSGLLRKRPQPQTIAVSTM